MHTHGPSCLEGPASQTFHDWSARSKEMSGDSIRWELVERIRQQIAGGTYDTPEKLQIALARLVTSLET